MSIFEAMRKRNLDQVFYREGEWSSALMEEFERFDEITTVLSEEKYEELYLFYDKHFGGRYAVSIHSTVLGPALGGFRVLDYRGEYEAINDVLRLSRGMTLKNSIVGLDLGGGKAVGWPGPGGKNEGFIRAFANFLERLEGRYITAEDVGSTVSDMDLIDEELAGRGGPPMVVCCSGERGGGGNPSPVTASGIHKAIKVCCEKVFGSSDLDARRVAIQGLGNVGSALAKLLLADGAGLLVGDIDGKRIKAIAMDSQCLNRCEVVSREDIYAVTCDVFSPCALGAVLNPETIPRLGCSIVAGSANNQLEVEVRDARSLSDRGILYAPDMVINAGGVSNAAVEYMCKRDGVAFDYGAVTKFTDRIIPNLKAIFNRAETSSITTHEAAIELALERIDAARPL